MRIDISQVDVHVYVKVPPDPDETLKAIRELRKVIMSKFEDANELLTAINGVTNEVAETVSIVVEKEALQLAEIQALKDQIAAGTPVSQEQLDSLVTGLEDRRATLEAVSAHLQTIATDPEDPTASE